MRKIIAIWAAKLSAIAGKLLGKGSSAGPGTIALKICPDLISRLKGNIKKRVIVTCGTNGKTTTNNLIYNSLTECGYSVLCNNQGANMLSGVATAFALKCNWLGKFEADYACLEIDEASTVRVFEYIKPDYIVITNLFRDQLDRYGEIEHTMEIINRAIDMCGNPTLILNGDDPLTASFGKERRKALYYGIGEKVLSSSDNVKEGKFCLYCGAEQKYNYVHYNQLGDYYCPECGNKRPEIDYEATDVDIVNGLSFSVKDLRIELNYRGFYNIYNILAVYAAMDANGIKYNDYKMALKEYKPQVGRMEEVDLGKPVILNLAKNPAGFNQAITTVLQDPRKKDVIFAVNDAPSDGQDVSWLWDVNFDDIIHDGLNSLSVTGSRKYDLALRFKYSEIKVNHISDNMKQLILTCLETDSEVCYVLVNYTALFGTEKIMLDIKKEKEVQNNG